MQGEVFRKRRNSGRVGLYIGTIHTLFLSLLALSLLKYTEVRLLISC